MQHLTNLISALTILGLVFSLCCNSQQKKSQKKGGVLLSNIDTVNSKLARPVQIGDKIELSGGYDYDPLYLKNPPSSKRSGVVVKFIKGQNEKSAAVIKLDHQISGEKITGDIVVLELRYVGQTWQEPTPVHIELCDFMPEDKTWKERKQGESVEAAATVTVVEIQK